MVTEKFIKSAAWLILAFIIAVTVSPIGLRPHTISTVGLDRAGAYALCAAAFVFAYPRYWKLTAFLIVLGAFGIEALQYLSPTRHPRLDDASIKALGATVGILFARSVNRLRKMQTTS
jgi:VanZ family protein